MQDEASKRRLDMRGRTAEPVVEIEMAEGSVEIVPPEQADDPAAEPDAFRIAGRPLKRVLRFGELVDLLGLFGRLLSSRRSFVSGLGIVALGESGRSKSAGRDRQNKERRAQSAGNAEQTMEHGST